MSAVSNKTTSPHQRAGLERRHRGSEFREPRREIPPGPAHEPHPAPLLVRQHPPAVVLLLVHSAVAVEGLGDLRRVHQVHGGERRRGHGSEAYQRSPHARQVPQERHFNARLAIRRPQAGQGRVCQPRGPAMPIRGSSHIFRRATRARSITGP